MVYSFLLEIDLTEILLNEQSANKTFKILKKIFFFFFFYKSLLKIISYI